MFRIGLFENPYLDVEETKMLAAKPEFIQAGYEAQIKSIVMLKNRENVLPVQRGMTVYIPQRPDPASVGGDRSQDPGSFTYPVNIDIVKKYFAITDDPQTADFALVFISSPQSGNGYSETDVKEGGTGYVPISLQYQPYRAQYARNPSIAGDPSPGNVLNRTYQNKTIRTSNASDLQLVLDARKRMGNKPVVVCINVSNPMVFNEFEQSADAILVAFDVQHQSILDIITGIYEPSGLLPFQMPANMRTVEEQYEDVPNDMECHMDSEGNSYDFAFGMNWTGVINDQRTEKYRNSEQ